MKSQATDGQQPAPGRAHITSRRWTVSLVWIVPIIAVLVGLSLVVNNWLQEGPTITITFKTGQGLTANKTPVKYRNVVIGQVTDVRSEEHTSELQSLMRISYAVFCLKKKTKKKNKKLVKTKNVQITSNKNNSVIPN